jgi:predicted membrane protein
MRIESRHRSRIQSRVVFGLIVIAIGVLALLDNLHLFDMQVLHTFWPLAFVVWGLLHIVNARTPLGPLFGIGLVGLGSVMTLQKLGILHTSLREWWPVFLILAGILIVARAFVPRTSVVRVHGLSAAAEIDHASLLDIRSAFSGQILKNDSQDFKGGRVEVTLGGIELDLRQASIKGEAVLQVETFMGGVAIKVPPEWQVLVQVSPTLGAVEDKTVPPMNPTQRLVIKGEVVVGGIEIKN